MDRSSITAIPGRAAGLVLLIGLASFAQSWLAIDGSDRTSGDPTQDARIALNMIRHGEFHDTPQLAWERNQGTLRPYAHTAPGPPTFLALIFWNTPEMIETIGAECYGQNRECRSGDAARTRVLRVGAVVRGITVAAAAAAAFALTGSLTMAMAGGVACLLLLAINWSTPSVLSGFFLLVHSVLAALTWRRPRIVTGAVSGIALGLLALTRTIFQYWLVGVAVLWLIGVWLYPNRRRATAPALAVLVVAAWAVALPWMIRSAAYAGIWGVSGSDAQVIAIRAEYGRMTWPEARGAFAYYLPFYIGSAREWIMDRVEPPVYGYTRFDRNNPEGFYQRANAWTGETAQRADRIEPEWRNREHAGQQGVQRQAAMALYLEELPKQAILTAAFALRGTEGLVLPALGGVWLLIRRRPGFELAFLLLPAISSAALLAVGSHFIERYGFPFMPLGSVIFTITVFALFSPPAPDEAPAS